MSPMNILEPKKNREDNILDAAVRVFMRYGVRRTTMNDIASEAGIVRQTLYNVFKNKDEVLCATIRQYADNGLAASAEEIEQTADLGEQLDILFTHYVVKGYDMMQQSPDADDVINGFNEMGREELARANERFQKAFADVLDPYEQPIMDSGYSVQELATFLASGAKGLKHQAQSRDQLMDMLATLKKAALHAAAE